MFILRSEGDDIHSVGDRGGQSAVLCGRNAVQLTFERVNNLSLDQLAKKLETVGSVALNPFLLRFEVDDYRLTLFPDGRAIVGGTEDVAEAKSVYAKYIGN